LHTSGVGWRSSKHNGNRAFYFKQPNDLLEDLVSTKMFNSQIRLEQKFNHPKVANDLFGDEICESSIDGSELVNNLLYS